MKRLLSLPILLLCLAYPYLYATAVQSADVPTQAVATLLESDTVSKSVQGPNRTRERISYLVRLTRVSADIAPTLTEQWCDELFDLASKSPLGWDRIANQKNAAVPLAKINPQKAMELLARVDLPQPHTIEGNFTEDVRADAAAVIFPAFAEKYGLDKIPEIQIHANAIGATGEYPYRAMARVMSWLQTSYANEAHQQLESIFRDALEHYKRHSQFEDEEEEFFNLLSSARHSVSPDLYRKALELYIKQVTTPTKADGLFAANVSIAQGTVIRLDDENRQLLWRVFPLLSDFDAEWGQRLVQEFPELKGAEAGVTPLGSAFISGHPTKEYADRKHQQMMDTSLLPRILTLREKDRNAAINLANRLTTLPARIIGASYVLPVVLDSDPVAAKQMYSQELQDLQKVTVPVERLQAKTAIAKSAYYLRDAPQVSRLSSQIIDQGTVLFEKDSKRNRADLHNGYREMGDMAEFAAAHGLSEVLQKVIALRDPLLKAHLMIFVAKGLAEAEPNSQVALGTAQH